MAKQTKVKLKKSIDIKGSPPLPVKTPVETPFVTSQQPKQYINFIFLGLLLAALLVTTFAVRKSTQQKYKAATEPIIAHVQLDPGVIITKTNAAPIQVSTLAYDKNYNPIWSGVGYNWGMSTAGSVGTLSLSPGNDKIAIFKPLNKGIGDIFVTATNVNGNGFGSIQVFVDVTPTPTPTPSPTLKPTPSPTPSPQPPTITSFTPVNGDINTLVTIQGTDFKSITGVTIHNTPARFVLQKNLDTTIRAYVARGTSTGFIKVIGTYGTAVSSTVFKVIPKILRLSPSSGKVGTTVTIYGSNFYEVTSVTFNGKSAQFSLISSTNIRAIVPAGATSGKVTVTTSGGTATSTTSYTVN